MQTNKTCKIQYEEMKDKSIVPYGRNKRNHRNGQKPQKDNITIRHLNVSRVMVMSMKKIKVI